MNQRRYERVCRKCGQIRIRYRIKRPSSNYICLDCRKRFRKNNVIGKKDVRKN